MSAIIDKLEELRLLISTEPDENLEEAKTHYENEERVGFEYDENFVIIAIKDDRIED